MLVYNKSQRAQNEASFYQEKEMMLQRFLQLWLGSIAQSLGMNYSQRVAATRCPATANLELQCGTKISQMSSNIIEVSLSKHAHLGLFARSSSSTVQESLRKVSGIFSLTLLISTTKFLKYVWMKVELLRWFCTWAYRSSTCGISWWKDLV